MIASIIFQAPRAQATLLELHLSALVDSSDRCWLCEVRSRAGGPWQAVFKPAAIPPTLRNRDAWGCGRWLDVP